MGFGVAINDSVRVEAIKSDAYIRLLFPHGDAVPGETTVSFPSHRLPEFISVLRAVAAHLGIPTKADWDSDYLEAVYDHDPAEVGHAVTPPRWRP